MGGEGAMQSTASTVRADASFLFLIANIVTTSDAPVTTSKALVTSSFLFLIASGV